MRPPPPPPFTTFQMLIVTSIFIIGSSKTDSVSLRAFCTHCVAQAEIMAAVVPLPISTLCKRTSKSITGKFKMGPEIT